MQIVEVTQPRKFQLSERFLESYYDEGDPFSTLLARSTYLTKYCRGDEVWTDTIRRVVEGNASLTSHVDRTEAEMLFHLFWTGQALPPGRSLWVGGVEGIPSDASYNCFSAETRFWANGILVSFEEAAGQTVEVLTKDGKWRSAEVRSFGKQKLYKYLLKAPGRSNFAFEYTATANHRWFTSNRGEVTDLQVGDRVRVTPTLLNFTSEQAYKDGYAHGFVFGDGSRYINKQGSYVLRLCGAKIQYADQIKLASSFYSDSSPPSYNGDPSIYFRSDINLKELPPDGLGVAYQSGFLAGWLAADGSIRADGRGSNRLSSQNSSALDWVVERAPLLGFCVTGRITDSSEETNYGPRSGRLEVLSLLQESVEYTVRTIIDEGREEDVFCVVEPETHSFTLEGGVVTGNCWFVTLRAIDDWCWLADRLMLGGGVGVGLSDISQLQGISSQPTRFAIWCSSEHPNINEVNPDPKSFLNGQTPIFKVPDSRQGWVEALRIALTSAFEGKDQIIDVSDVRARGELIRTFGGKASGPGPLVDMLRNVWGVVRSAVGRKLSSIDCLDITNHVGFCVKSGNIRRSAIIMIGDPKDRDFRDAKKDFSAVKSHRHTSNNTLAFRSQKEIDSFNWNELVDDVVTYGEPGVLNLPLVWKTDSEAEGLNPCLTGDTRIATQFGLIPISELTREGKALEVTADTRVEVGYNVNPDSLGVVTLAATPAFQTSASECVHRITTAKGYTIEATSYHKFPTPQGFKELRNLQVGGSLLLQSAEGQWGSDRREVVYDGESRIPEGVWCSQRSYVVSYLKSIFSRIDVQIITSQGVLQDVIWESSPEFLKDLQVLLTNLGIVSSLLSGCKLHIGSRFAKQLFGELDIPLDYPTQTSDVRALDYCDEIVAIEPTGVQPVYCTTQESHHTFVANGIVSGNCGEQALHNKESCNLAEVFPAKFQEGTDPDQVFRLVTRYCLRQRLTPLTDPVSEAVGKKNMRVGVSLGGVCDFNWDTDLLSHYFTQCREEATSYAKELKVADPLTTTTVKPSGTTSLLCGSSPGIHAPYAPYYIRRARLAKNDPMVEPLIEAGVPHEPDIYDKNGHTLVFSFPMKAPHTNVTVQSQTLVDQFERQALVQEYWADNAVSSTISFNPDEKQELAECLSKYVPRLKSTSCLSRAHGYAQAPYEEVDEATWKILYNQIQNDHPLTRGGDMDAGGECEGGACPVK